MSIENLIIEELNNAGPILNSYFNNSSVGIGLTTIDGKFLAMNETMEKLISFSKDEINQMGVSETYVNSTEQNNMIRKLIADGKIHDYEVVLKRKDNSEFIALLNNDLIDINGQEIIHCTLRDITHLKRTNEMLLKNIRNTDLLNRIIIKGNMAKNLTTFFEEILDMILNILDFDGGGIYFVNKSSRTAKVVSSKGLPMDFINQADNIKIDIKPYNLIFISGEPIFTDNYESINLENAKKWDFKSIASIPIFAKKKIIGALNIASKTRVQFTAEEKEILQFLGREIGSVIEKLKSEQKLKESEERMKFLVSSSPVMIYTSRMSGDYGATFLSDNVLEMTGYKPEDFINSSEFWIDHVHPEDRERVLLNLEGLTVKGKILYDYRFKYKDGTYHWMRDEVKLITDEKGNPVEAIGSWVDITERKKVEEELKNREDFLSNIFSSIQDGLYVFNKDYKIIKSNPIMDEWFPFIAPIEGKHCYSIFNRRTEPCTDCRCFERLKTELLFSEIITKRGEQNEVVGMLEKHCFPLTDPYKNEINGIIVYLRDITESYKSEELLRESEEKYRNIFDNAFDVIYIHDLDGNFLEINEIACKRLGYTREEFLNMTPWDIVSETNKFDIPKGFEKFLTIEQSFIETEHLTKDGKTIPAELSIKVIQYNGNPAILCISRDITERKRAGNMIRQELEKLKDLDELKTEFVYRASHELKTPLISISSASELLLTLYKEKVDNKARSLMEIVHNGGKRLGDLIETLLDASRLESNKMELKLENKDIIDIIKKCVKTMEPLINERNISLNTDLLGECFIRVDKLRIKQVFINLLSNAIKNTPSYGEIYIKIKETGEYCDIQFRDTGVGITVEEASKIFQKFGKIERYGQGMDIITEGLGLGLFISKEIVELHEGNIWVESAGRNIGATFTVKLPISN